MTSLLPVIERIDQTTDTIVVRNAVSGATIQLDVDGAPILKTSDWRTLGLWTLAGNTLGANGSIVNFGNIHDGRPFWTGNFSGSGRAELLFFFPGDGNWWLGQCDGKSLSWVHAGNGIGSATDQAEFGSFDTTVFVGDFTGSGFDSLLVYIRGKGNWHIGQFSGTTLNWAPAGDTRGFGEVGDGRPFWTGKFSGSGRAELLFYFPGDGNWWLGQYDGTNLSWVHAGNGIGSATDQAEFGSFDKTVFVGDFTGSGRDSLLVYIRGKGNWRIGRFSGTTLNWAPAGDTRGFGEVGDGRPFWTGKFSGSDRAELLFYYPGDGNWWRGQCNDTSLSWSLAGNTLGKGAGQPNFGQLADGRPIWAAPFTGFHQSDILFYFPGDRNWWLGIFKAGELSWSLASNTRGLGQVWDGRPFWTADFQGLGRHSVLFYTPSDTSGKLSGDWRLGCFDRAQVAIPGLLVPGNKVTATQTLNGTQSSPSATVVVELAYTTQHFDRNRTGWNPYEEDLTIAACQGERGSPGLRSLFQHCIDGQAYAQPLYVPKLDIPGMGTHNVVFIATENGTVYIFDADNASGANSSWLRKRSLFSVNEGPMPSTVVGTCPNVVPSIGITGTPVIDLANQTLFLVVKAQVHTLLPSGSRNSYVQRLHALDITTLEDRAESPLAVEATLKAATFTAQYQNQRPGLLLRRGAVYVAWAGHCDLPPYFGWIISYQAGTLNRIAQFNAAPDAYQAIPVSPGHSVQVEKMRSHSGAGIWQGGIGLACDAEGNIYCLTGNGDYSVRDGGSGYGNCVVKLSTDLIVLDYFMPFNVENLDPLDQDLGSGAACLIPNPPGGKSAPLLLACGKEGKIYVLNRSNLGKFDNTWGAESNTNIVQTIDLYPGQVIDGAAQPTGTDSKQPGVWGGPAYAIVGSKRLVFYCGNYGARPLTDPTPPGGPVKAFTVSEAALPLAYDLLPSGQVNQSTVVFPAINAGGATPVVSSSNTRPETAIVWLIKRTNPLGLVAFNPADLSQQVVDQQAGPWRTSRGAPMIEPTVIKGKVYVGSDSQLNVYGL